LAVRVGPVELVGGVKQVGVVYVIEIDWVELLVQVTVSPGLAVTLEGLG
jgi:hypothetical protein